MSVCSTACVRSEDNFVELILSFIWVLGGWSQGTKLRFGGLFRKHLYLIHHSGPKSFIFKWINTVCIYGAQAFISLLYIALLKFSIILESLECPWLPTLSVYQHWVLWACKMFKQDVYFPNSTGLFHVSVLVILINICIIISFVICDVSIVIVLVICGPHRLHTIHSTEKSCVFWESQ